MASLRSTLGRAARRTGAGRRLAQRRAADAARAAHTSTAARLVTAGVVDQEWYEVLSGLRFSGPDEAAFHYVAEGRKAGLSIHPLIEPTVLEPERWKTKNVDPALDYVLARHARSPHPLFDEAAYRVTHPGCETGPGSSVGHFLRSAGPSAELPVPAGVPVAERVWSRWRAQVLEAARLHAERKRLTGPRTSPTFDRSRHDELVRRWSGARQVPRGDGPVVSVVMPVRNRPDLVPAAIASVQAQTLVDWELVIVDDGSTDRTPEVLAALAEEDTRIRVIRGEARGVSAARNTAIEHCRGEVVAFLDSDNAWNPWFLTTAVGMMREAGSGFAYAGLEVHHPDRVEYRVYEGGRDHLQVANHIPLIVLVVDRELLQQTGGFDESMRRWVDHDLVLRLSEHEQPIFLPFIGASMDEAPAHTDRITATESEAWQYVALQNGLFRWSALEEGLGRRVPGRVSVLMPTYQDWLLTADAVRAVLATAGGHDVEVVVVDNGSARVVATMLAGLLQGLPGVRIVSRPRNLNFAVGSNLAFAESSGEVAVFLNNDTVVRDGWLEPLLRELDDPSVVGAQPLLLYGDGTVQCAGVWFAGGDVLPSHFLSHHPAEDARRLGTFAVSAVTGAATVLRARDVVRGRGFDPLYVNGWEDIDLCLRLGEGRGARPFRVVTASTVMHLESKSTGRRRAIVPNRAVFHGRWRGRMPAGDVELVRRAGLELGGLDPVHERERGALGRPKPILVRPRRWTSDGVPSLRWALKIAARSGVRGDTWGDTYYADDLAAALRRLGQEVVVDRHDAYDRPTVYLDDVTLTLRGVDDVVPLPGRVNLLWVISHPELVTAEEVRRYDAAFAAGPAWARRMSDEAGVAVEPLLQATDPAKFNPDLRGDGDDVLFIGNSRGVDRRVVSLALEAGLDLALYGQGWRGRVPDGLVRAEVMPNSEVGRAYASAGVVLCDHWPDMAEQGFFANRLFDAVASGARVVSDHVAGLEEVFGPLVAVFRDAEDLRRLAGPGRDRWFLPDEERAAAGREFGAQNSFDVRARVLLERALALHAQYEPDAAGHPSSSG